MCAFFYPEFFRYFFFPRELLEKKQINLRKGCRYTTINEQYDDDFDENDSAFLQEDDDDDWRRKKEEKEEVECYCRRLGREEHYEREAEKGRLQRKQPRVMKMMMVTIKVIK